MDKLRDFGETKAAILDDITQKLLEGVLAGYANREERGEAGTPEQYALAFKDGVMWMSNAVTEIVGTERSNGL